MARVELKLRRKQLNNKTIPTEAASELPLQLPPNDWSWAAPKCNGRSYLQVSLRNAPERHRSLSEWMHSKTTVQTRLSGDLMPRVRVRVRAPHEVDKTRNSDARRTRRRRSRSHAAIHILDYKPGANRGEREGLNPTNGKE